MAVSVGRLTTHEYSSSLATCIGKARRQKPTRRPRRCAGGLEGTVAEQRLLMSRERLRVRVRDFQLGMGGRVNALPSARNSNSYSNSNSYKRARGAAGGCEVGVKDRPAPRSYRAGIQSRPPRPRPRAQRTLHAQLADLRQINNSASARARALVLAMHIYLLELNVAIAHASARGAPGSRESARATSDRVRVVLVR